MSRKDLLSWFTANSESLSTEKILFLLCMALAVGAVIFATYKVTYAGVSYNARFNVTNVIILLITTVIMLMISSNIAISIGMVGALSIVRYRTAIKDPHDTVYIFWSIVEGLCVGAQIERLAIISTLFIAAVLIATSFYTRIQKKYLIIIRGNSDLDIQVVSDKVESLFKKSKIRTVNQSNATVEMIYEVSLNVEIDLEAVTMLYEVENVVSANWLLESGEHIG